MFGELLKFPEHKAPHLQTQCVISNAVKEPKVLIFRFFHCVQNDKK